jgi:glucosamine-6-phosphate deaminase
MRSARLYCTPELERRATDTGDMQIKTYVDRSTMSRAAARHAAHRLRDAIRERGDARIIAATGASQFTFLESLTTAPDIDWGRVEMFHLDEYVGLPIEHPASFRKYLIERLINATGLTRYHLLDGEGDAAAVAEQVGHEISKAPIDLAFVGIGENGHLAFNDPPADFTTETPYLIVTLDEACRRQQVGEGWFPSVADVPRQAISMSVRQILKTREILCIVPDARKAEAVRACVEGDISPVAPASILRTHASTTLYLDRESASLLSAAARGGILTCE